MHKFFQLLKLPNIKFDRQRAVLVFFLKHKQVWGEITSNNFRRSFWKSQGPRAITHRHWSSLYILVGNASPHWEESRWGKPSPMGFLSATRNCCLRGQWEAFSAFYKERLLHRSLCLLKSHSGFCMGGSMGKVDQWGADERASSS